MPPRMLLGLALLLAVTLANLGALVVARLFIARAFAIPGIRFPFRTDPATTREGTSGWARPACALAAFVVLYLVASTVAALGYSISGKIESKTDGTVDVIPGGPAEIAGMRDGDRVIAIEGAPITTWDQLSRTLQAHPGEPLDLTVEREGRAFRVEVIPGPKGSPSAGKIRVRQPQYYVAVGAGEAIAMGLQVPGSVIRNFVRGLSTIFAGKMESELAGPVGIVQQTGKVAQTGVGNGLIFASALSAYAMPVLTLVAFVLVPGRRKRAPR